MLLGDPSKFSLWVCDCNEEVMFDILSFQSFSEYLLCCFLELYWSTMLGWEMFTVSVTTFWTRQVFLCWSMKQIWVMRETVPVCVRRCLTWFIMCLKDCLSKINTIYVMQVPVIRQMSAWFFRLEQKSSSITESLFQKILK